MADWWFTLWQSLELILVISSIRFLLFIPFPFKLEVNNFSMRILKGFMNLHIMFCDFFIENKLIFYNDSSLFKCFPYCIQAIFTSRVIWLENYYEYAVSEKLLTLSFFFFFCVYKPFFLQHFLISLSLWTQEISIKTCILWYKIYLVSRNFIWLTRTQVLREQKLRQHIKISSSQFQTEKVLLPFFFVSLFNL